MQLIKKGKFKKLSVISTLVLLVTWFSSFVCHLSFGSLNYAKKNYFH